MICPYCKRKVNYIFSKWDRKLNNGNFNCCKYCNGNSKHKSLKELNEERKKQ